ncbi:TonB-dependent receptor domain-containing protein [Sphingomonas sp.]|jgi:outer membrane receptor protein involved in Fe transport|uniref:TonB-dependent receptor domain-containing protein n=1 Tax=Sphingomonas sp. TaxID=28214 RepID=UPI002D80BA24|nr:TonB-dependent receptor [Sphingomonas sp.]HEU0044601.1 TonB-dependent receptor [Sphingomonas sp.]
MAKQQFLAACAFSALALASASPAVAQVAGDTGAQGAPAQAVTQEPIEQRTLDDATVREIVVTGSLIAGTREDSALPVDVFSSAELTAEGQTSPLDFIKDIPAVGAVLGDSNQFSTAAQGLGGVGSINLRGLGSTRTLVLLNSRRTIVSPGDGVVDTNLLPIFALERIELLKDGAAVTYGSDAVAGVANFITRSRFDGVEVQGDWRFIKDSDGDYTGSILVGKNLNEDVNLLGGFGYRHRSPLAANDRDFSNLPYAINPAGYSQIATPATYFIATKPGTNGAIRNNPALAVRPTTLAATPFLDRGCPELGGTVLPASIGSPVPACYYQYTDYNNLVEKQDFYQAFGQLNVRLSDRTRFHLDVLWARSRTDTKLSPSYASTSAPAGPGTQFNFFVPASNPGFAAFRQQVGLPATVTVAGLGTIPVPGVSTLLFRPFALGGNPLTEFPFGNDSYSKNNSWRVSGGFDHELSDSLNASLFATYVNATSDSLVPDVIGTRLQDALSGFGGPGCDVVNGTAGTGGCQYFNPFSNSIAGNPVLGVANPFYTGPATSNLAGNSNDPALIRWLFGNTGTLQEEQQVVVDGVISGGTGIDFGGGEVKFGIGAQYRSSRFTSRPRNDEGLGLNDRTITPCSIVGFRGCNVQTGPFVFLGQSTRVNVSQGVYAVFGEVQVPITSRLELTGAVRFEDYGEPVGSTLDPKASIRWQPLDWLTLRGSVTTTFRAPLAGQVAATSVTALQTIEVASSNFRSVDVLGNPTNLGPESAFTYNIGAVVKTGGFNLQVDYFSFDFDGRISATPANPIARAVVPTVNGLANCASPLASSVVFQNGCVQGVTRGNDISRVITQFVNGPTTKTSGLDVEVDYTFDFGEPKLTFGAAFTKIFKYEVGDFELNGVTILPAYSALGFSNYFRDPGTVSEWKGNAFANLNWSGLNARYVFRYASGVDDDRCVGVPAPCLATVAGGTDFGRKIKDFTQSDVTILYDLPFEFAAIQLQASVENLFDQAPSAARLELGYDPFFGNPIGRAIRVGARVRF